MSGTISASKQGDDLSAKTRIRNVALDLCAAYGEDGTSMRAIAHGAGVTVGLVVHHFGTKDRLRQAVESHVVDMFVEAINQVPADLAPTEVATARDASVAHMLAENPAVVSYLRRALLDPTGYRGSVLEMLTSLTAERVAALREAGAASQTTRAENQVIGVMVGQLGHLFLQPMIDMMWAQLADPDAKNEEKPRLVVRVERTG